MEEKSKKDRQGKYYLFTFESTHVAIAAQKTLTDRNPHMIPAPQEITANCGMALRFEAKNEQEALSIGLRIPEARGMCSLYAMDAMNPGFTRSLRPSYHLIQKL